MHIKGIKSTNRKEWHCIGFNWSSINLKCFLNFRTVKENLRMILSVSSPGSKFQRKCRDFPGLINSISIMFFPHWSRENLVSRAGYLLRGKYITTDSWEHKPKATRNIRATIKARLTSKHWSKNVACMSQIWIEIHASTTSSCFKALFKI